MLLMAATDLPPNGERPASLRGWARAIVAAAVMVVLSFVALVLVPNTLLGYLTTRVVPTWRDLLVVLYWMAAFAGCCWAFLLLQRQRSA
jgi:hypothetical protein